MKIKYDHTRSSTPRSDPHPGPVPPRHHSALTLPKPRRVWQDTTQAGSRRARAGFRGFLPRTPASRSADARVASGFTRLQTPPHVPAHTGKSLSRSGSGRGAGGQPQLCADPASPVGTERSLFSVPANAGHPQRRSIRPSTPALLTTVTGAPCPISFTTSVCLSVCLHSKRFSKPYD